MSIDESTDDRYFLEKANTYVPQSSCTLSKRPAAYPSLAPTFAITGEGARLMDEFGRVYLDWVCSLGATTLGYAHPRVVAAVTDQVQRGTIFSLPHILEAKVAERLASLIPCAEQTKFFKTGSEACAAVVRTARIATGRQRILFADDGYHGWHDWFIASKAEHPGVPDFMQAGIETFKQGDVDSLRRAIRVTTDRDGEAPAAIMLEPKLVTTEFLKEVRKTAHDICAVLIFDETLTGGRLALAGGQQYYGVTPDMATFGKALGGGLPLAFVCGARDLMQYSWPASGTFSGDALALAACMATLDAYEQDGVLARLWAAGVRVQDALYDRCPSGAGLPYLYTRGHPPHFSIQFGADVDRRLAMSVFVQRCAMDGVLVHQAMVNSCAAVTDAELERSALVMGDAISIVAGGVQAGNLAELLIGDQFQDSVR